MKLLLLFSFEISLQDWIDSGLFDREVELYRKLIHQYPVQVQFLTYGDARDRSSESHDIGLLPVYESQPRHSVQLIRLLRTLFLPSALAEHFRGVDIYKTNQMMGAWVGIIGKVFFRKPLLVRCGYELSEFLRLGRAKWWHRLGGWALSFIVYHFADRIHVATHNDEKIVRKRFRVSPKKIHVRPNWVNTEIFCPPTDAHERRHDLLFVGRFTDQKNLPLLIDAITGTDFKLTVVGAGELESEIKRRVDEQDVVVDFRGRIANNSLVTMYQKSLIYVLCSHYEGNPKTLLEAMACGCAVIGTDVPGVREIIDNKKNGILVDPNPVCLRQAIVDLFDDPNFCQDLGNAARKTILQKYDLDAAVEAEWHAYNALTGGR